MHHAHILSVLVITMDTVNFDMLWIINFIIVAT